MPIPDNLLDCKCDHQLFHHDGKKNDHGKCNYKDCECSGFEKK
jgi:hypothetical protein